MAENSYQRSLGKSMSPNLPGENSRRADKEREAALAKERLRDGEDAASDGISGDGIGDEVGAARGREALGGGSMNFTGSGRAAEVVRMAASGTKGGGFKGFLKKRAPILAIFLGIVGGGAAVVGVQSLMPFHVVEQMVEANDGSFTSRTSRMSRIGKWIFNLQNDEDSVVQTRKNLFGEEYKKYRTGVKKYSNKLEAQGIEVVKLESTGERALVWTDNAGKKTTIKASGYGEMYENNTEFRNAMNRGTRGFTGRIAAWIDVSAARFFKSRSLSKNLFSDWADKVLAAEGEDTTFADIIKGRKPKSEFEVGDSRYREREIEVVDADGNTSIEIEEPRTTSATRTKVDVGSLVSNAAGVTSSVVCGTAAAAAVVTGVRAAMMISNAMNYAQAIFEATDKVKAGDGTSNGGSPIHEAATDLLEKDADGKTALEAEGMKTVVSGGTYKADLSETTTAESNIEAMYKSVGTTLGFVIGCEVANIVTAGVSIALEVLTLGSFSIGKTVIALGTSAAVAIGAEIMVNELVKNIETDFCVDAQGLARGTCLALGGSNELQTNFQYGGGTIATKSKVADFYDAQQLALEQEAEYDRATKSPFDVTNEHTFLGSLVRKVGVPIAQATGSLTGVTSMFSGVVSGSLASILPSSYAIDKTTYMENQIGDCPNLESIGAVGNIYCTPIVVTDMSTMDYNPEEVMNKIAADYGGYEMEDGKVKLDDNGTEVIKFDSNLGKYLLYCTERTSPFGTVDANITTSETNDVLTANSGNGTVDSTLNAVISAVPILGDVLQISRSARTVRALPWSTGANCVARDEGTYASGEASGGTSDDSAAWDFSDFSQFDSVDWSEMKYYQRYVEDDRLMQSVDDDYNSAVTAFFERYEEENPVDDSLEGVLARDTGYTKEQVSVALNDMLYWEYLADYEPEGLYPVPVEEGDAELNFGEDESAVLDEVAAVVVQNVVYAPLRYRNFAA